MKKFARILTAAVAVAGSVMGLAPAAQAAPGNTVLLGDSYFANTTLNQIIDAKLGNARGCIQGKFRVATELQRLTGARVDDYSCNGKELYLGREPLEARLDQAIRDGKLNRNTRNVPIMVGANDTYRTLDPINNQAAARSYDRLAKKNQARCSERSYPVCELPAPHERSRWPLPDPSERFAADSGSVPDREGSRASTVAPG